LKKKKVARGLEKRRNRWAIKERKPLPSIGVPIIYPARGKKERGAVWRRTLIGGRKKEEKWGFVVKEF